MFSTEFLRGLRRPDWRGVRLVISDHHLGLKEAIAAVMIGAAWQRCWVHLLRKVLARVPKGSADMVAAAVRTILAQPDSAAAPSSSRPSPKSSTGVSHRLLDAARRRAGRLRLRRLSPEPLEIWSTNPLERVNVDIKRRVRRRRHFANENSVLRVASAVLLEVHDEWQVAERRYLAEGSMAKLMRRTRMTRRKR